MHSTLCKLSKKDDQILRANITYMYKNTALVHTCEMYTQHLGDFFHALCLPYSRGALHDAAHVRRKRWESNESHTLQQWWASQPHGGPQPFASVGRCTVNGAYQDLVSIILRDKWWLPSRRSNQEGRQPRTCNFCIHVDMVWVFIQKNILGYFFQRKGLSKSQSTL